MKQLKLIPHSWQPSDVAMPMTTKTPPTFHSPGRSPKRPDSVVASEPREERSPHEGRQRQQQPGGDVMQTPIIDRMLGSERLLKLRESLSNITQTPVRTLHSGKKYEFV